MVIPSYYMVNSGPDKDALIEEYNSTLQEIPCKHLIGAMGNVPSLIVASMSTDSKMASCMSIPGRIIRCLLMAFGRVITS